MTEREHTNGDGDGLTLAVVADRMDRLEEAVRRLTEGLEVIREEGRQARAVISQALGAHNDEVLFYLVQYIGAFNRIGGKMSALAEIITGHELTDIKPEHLVRGSPKPRPLPELQPDGSIKTIESSEAAYARRVGRRRPRDS